MVDGDGQTGRVGEDGLGADYKTLSFITVEFEEIGRDIGFDFL